MPNTDYNSKDFAVQAITLATTILPQGSSVEDVKAAAKKLVAFINGDETSVDEAVAETDDTPTVAPLELFRVEYNNRMSAGTHFGRNYKTAKGAAKNSKNPAYVRTVRFVEAEDV